MGDLSKHFSTYELACKGKNCCGRTCAMNPKLIAALEEFRVLIDVAFSPNSAFRCNRHNEREGGAKHSQHILGFAVDIPRLEGHTVTSMAEVAKTVKDFADGGIGLYDTFIHLDVRGVYARWDNRS